MPGAAGIIQLQEIILRLINISVRAAFIIVLIVLVWAGIKYLTSGGDSKSISSAGLTITWALLGILFLVIAWLVIKLVAAYTGVEVTLFCLGFPGSQGNTSCF